MTPIAAKLARLLLVPFKKRDVFDPKGVHSKIVEAHCFEMTAVQDLADDFADSILHHGCLQKRLAFLPAPLTVLEELQPPNGCSHDRQAGDLLIESEDKKSADVFSLSPDGLTWIGKLALENEAELSHHIKSVRDDEDVPGDLLASSRRKAAIYARLALINTPRIIGRRQHMPHAGFQRNLAHSRGMVGKFPLHAWTEILLEVTPPIYDGDKHEAYLTGGKALHFCRAHLRVRLGRLELVSAHWRGDPALGIKQSRYRVVPPGKA